MTQENPNLGLEILGKADAIIREVERSRCGSVHELAEAVGEPVSSTYRLLSNLRLMGWIDDAPQRGRYRLGLEFLQIGSQVEDLRNPQEEALPRLKRLNQQTHLTTFLCVRRGDEAVCVGRFEGRSVRSLVLTLGGSLSLDRGAAAKALLAHLPQAEQEGVLSRLGYRKNSEKYTEKLAELASYREHQLAVSDEDVTPGIGALGAPVFNFRGETVASISVSGLRAAVVGNQEVTDQLKVAAEQISSALGYEGVNGAFSGGVSWRRGS